MEKIKESWGRDKIINLFKVVTNIILIVLIILSGVAYFNYTKEINQALGFEPPTLILDKYTELTGEYCVCDSDFRKLTEMKLLYNNKIKELDCP